MISRQSGFGLGVALSLAWVCATFDALAQDTAPTTEGSPTDTTAPSTADAPAASASTAVEPAAPPTQPSTPSAEQPASTGAEAPASVSVSAGLAATATPAGADAEADVQGSPGAPPGPPPTDSTPTTATGTSVEREQTVALLGLEQLPGSAYPSVHVRGIKYGSLWRTFHGQQWPYMPMLGNKPGTRIGFSGYIWNDLSNTRIGADASLAGANVNDQNRWTTQTRGILRVTPTYNAGGDWFVQGNAEAVIQGDMRPDPSTGVLATTDDIFVRVGKWNVFDLTFGRFQGWEIANHYGMALDQNTLERSGAWIVSSSLPRPADGYGLSYFWDRQNFLLGTYALHVYPTEYLRAELLGHLGAGNSSNASNPYQLDIRPSAIFDIGYLKVKAGWEYGKATPQDTEQRVNETKNGFGVAAQVVLDPYVEFGGNFARGFQDVVDNFDAADLAASNTVQTVGGFVNASPGHEPLVIGLGAFLNHWEDMRIDSTPGPHQGKVDTNDQWLIFGAAQYTFWDNLYVKAVVSHASNKVEHYNAGNYINNALSGRVRVEFLY
jgi:hypothetical protein